MNPAKESEVFGNPIMSFLKIRILNKVKYIKYTK